MPAPVKHSLLAALALLAGCAPAYNWREVRPADPAVVVMLPGKPASLTQRVRLDGLDLQMSMTGAQAEGAAFTVACAALPVAQADAPTRERVLAAMRSGMTRNIAGTEERAEAVEVALVDAAGVARGRASGLRVVVNGTVKSRPTRMLGVFVGEGARACQAVAVGESLPDEQARQFSDSLRLVVAAG